MSYLLPHLHTGWAVDQAILNEEDRVVVIRFGHDYDPVCMQQDETLCKIAEDIKNFGAIYLVDITEVPDFNTMCVCAGSGWVCWLSVVGLARVPLPGRSRQCLVPGAQRVAGLGVAGAAVVALPPR